MSINNKDKSKFNSFYLNMYYYLKKALTLERNSKILFQIHLVLGCVNNFQFY